MHVVEIARMLRGRSDKDLSVGVTLGYVGAEVVKKISHILDSLYVAIEYSIANKRLLSYISDGTLVPSMQ